MSYRDDREALRARVEALEGKLADADSASAEQRARYEAELRRLRAPWSGSVRATVVVGSIVTCGMAMAGAGFFLARAPARFDAISPVAPPTPIPAPEVLAPEATQVLRWHAKVHSATGVKLQVGARCTVVAVVDSRGGELTATTTRVTLVQCGKESLYVPGVDGSNPEASVAAAIRDTPTSDFSLRFTSAPDAPLTVAIDSLRETALLEHTAEPTLRVQLDVNPYASREVPAR